MSSMTFNTNTSIVSFCHNEGAALYTLDGTNPIPYAEIDLKIKGCPDILIAERIGTTDCCFLVCARHPADLLIYSTHLKSTSKVGYKLSYTTHVRSIKSNSQRVAVCLVDSIVIYEMQPGGKLKSIRKQPISKYNVPGVFDLCQGDESLIAYPAKVPGEVRLYDALKCEELNLFKVHESPITALKLNANGSLLATASQKGTVIRVVDVKSGSVVYNFCRSLLREANVYALAFSPNSQFLASTSDSGTVHLFQLKESGQGNAVTNISENLGIGFVGQFLNSRFANFTKQADQYIPGPIARPKSIATGKVEPGIRSDIAIKVMGGIVHLLIALGDGEFSVFRYNNDAELQLMERFELGNRVNRSSSSDSDF